MLGCSPSSDQPTDGIVSQSTTTDQLPVAKLVQSLVESNSRSQEEKRRLTAALERTHRRALLKSLRKAARQRSVLDVTAELDRAADALEFLPNLPPGVGTRVAAALSHLEYADLAEEFGDHRAKAADLEAARSLIEDALQILGYPKSSPWWHLRFRH